MIIKCPNCSGALIYNPESGKMECAFCNSQYSPDSFEEKEVIVERNEEEINVADEDSMECNIYTCTSCGAELAVNGVESSTYCAYCGQPTIVFSRVSNELKPNYVIPFKISKESAVMIIRKKLNKGFYVPREIKNFEVEKVRGIYIPFFLYNVHYYDKQHLTGKVRSGKSTVTKHFLREACCDFEKMTIDASRNLIDESSQRLEPYSMLDLKAFDVSYMSGYYADRFDENEEMLKRTLQSRAEECFNEEIKKSVKASSIKIVEQDPQMDIIRKDYALLPAWFLTFRYLNEPYTMLVNGQTGKIVGTVPYKKNKAIALFIVLSLILTFVIFYFIGMLVGLALPSRSITSSDTKVFTIITVLSGTAFVTGYSMLKKYENSLELTKSRRTERFSKERQDN